MGTVRYLGRGHRPNNDPVTAKMAFFSLEKSIPGDSTDHIWTFLKTALTFDRHIEFFYFMFSRDRIWIRAFIHLKCRRAESARLSRK